jgi:FtsH-binding integral membrane protein
MFVSATEEYRVYRDAGDINQAMARVYGYMFMAVLVSMFTSYQVGTNHQLMEFFFTGITKWIVIFAPLVYIFFVPVLLNAGIGRTGSQLVLYSFAALMGLSLATIFVVYTLGSIFTAFMGAAVLFGVMSLYGYFTKKDLSDMGSMLFIALIAIIIASVINIFIGSTVLQMVISAIAIVVFLGFTAYDTQQIRQEVSVEDDGRAEIVGALTLYLDFINLFVNLLQLIGVAPSKDD